MALSEFVIFSPIPVRCITEHATHFSFSLSNDEQRLSCGKLLVDVDDSLGIDSRSVGRADFHRSGVTSQPLEVIVFHGALDGLLKFQLVQLRRKVVYREV